MGARKYSQALFALAMKDGILGKVRSDVELLIRSTGNEKTLEFLASREVPREEKLEAFKDLDELTRSFLALVIDNRQEAELPQILTGFMEMVYVEVDVHSRVALTAAEKEKLKKKLAKHLEKKVELKFNIDKSVIGGLLLRYNGTVMDGTVNGRLDGMLRELVA